jgi:enoyl-CoA hydratase
LVAAGGGLLRLPQRIPFHRALALALTGATIDGAEAHVVGLVNSLTQPGDALAEALRLAGVVVANGPLAVRATKRVVYEAATWPPDEAFDRQREISEPVRSSEDAREGARSFVERRPARWRGR